MKYGQNLFPIVLAIVGLASAGTVVAANSDPGSPLLLAQAADTTAPKPTTPDPTMEQQGREMGAHMKQMGQHMEQMGKKMQQKGRQMEKQGGAMDKDKMNNGKAAMDDMQMGMDKMEKGMDMDKGKK